MSTLEYTFAKDKNWVGLAVCIEQDISNTSGVIAVRSALISAGVVFINDSNDDMRHLQWFNLRRPHLLRQELEKALHYDLDHEQFLKRYGEFLYGIRNFDQYPSSATTQGLMITEGRNPRMGIIIEDELLESSRRSVAGRIRDFFGELGIENPEEFINRSDLLSGELGNGSTLARRPVFISLGRVNRGTILPNINTTGMEIRLTPPHLTHVTFKEVYDQSGVSV